MSSFANSQPTLHYWFFCVGLISFILRSKSYSPLLVKKQFCPSTSPHFVLCLALSFIVIVLISACSVWSFQPMFMWATGKGSIWLTTGEQSSHWTHFWSYLLDLCHWAIKARWSTNPIHWGGSMLELGNIKLSICTVKCYTDVVGLQHFKVQ